MQSYGPPVSSWHSGTEMIDRAWRVELAVIPVDGPRTWYTFQDVRAAARKAGKPVDDLAATITWRTYHVTARCRVSMISRTPRPWRSDTSEEHQAVRAACQLAREDGLCGLTDLDAVLYGTPNPVAALE